MKQNSIQYLLEKYREGTLSDEERVELESLTHKDEVMAAAGRKVRGIIWRRVSLTVAAVMIVGAGALTLLPRTQEPLLAEAQEVPAVQEEMPMVEDMVRPALPQTVAPVAKPQPTAHKAVAKPAKKKSEEPVVVCNNQCEADSVLNDIRKFLSV